MDILMQVCSQIISVILGSGTITMMMKMTMTMMMATMTIISTMTSKTMMRCSRPSAVLARPDCTRQSHSTSSSVIFDRDNDFDSDDNDSDDVLEKDNCETGDDDAMQMERPGALPSEVAAAWTLISFQR